MKVSIIYYSGTGCTERMADLIKEAFSEDHVDINLKQVKEAKREDIEDADIIFLGSPALGPERVEEYVMEPYLQSNKELFKGKKVGLFGSYDWGDGKWMREWVERMDDWGAKVHGDGCINKLYPDKDEEDSIREYGRTILD